MTHTPQPTFGRALGEAARWLTKLHRRALADLVCDFPTWMLYTLLTEKGGALPVDQIATELNLRMDLAAPDTRRVLDRAAAAGHVTFRPDDPATVAALTESGTAYFASLYAHARAATDRAVDGVDPAMVTSAVTVLVAVQERAIAQLA